MSPTEHDLRGALHDGEGDGAVDVDRLIGAVNARSAQRRVRIRGAVAAAALVVVGSTVTLAVRSGSGSGDSSAGSEYSAGSADGAGSAGSAVSRAAGGGAVQASPSAPGSASSAAPPGAATEAVRCPSSLPRSLLPGGGSPGQFGAGGALFAEPVAGVVVCAYGSRAQALDQTPAPAPTRLVLTGAPAQQLAASLEGADKNRAHLCPTVHAATADEFALYGITAAGRRLRGVTVSLTSPTCQSMITNGTAVRYAWSPPPALRDALRRLRPTATPS